MRSAALRGWAGPFSSCCLALALASPAFAQLSGEARPDNAGAAIIDVNAIDPETFQAIAARLPEGSAPKIDGRLNDEAWELAPPSGNFIQRDPHFGAPSSERTEFRILYDDRKIYFGIWAYDRDPGGIRASEMKRDSGLRKGDQIKITIDTFRDKRNAFYFSTNPLGALKDAQTTEEGRTVNYDWNAVWECKTSVDERGWYVEIAIPLSQLRFKGSPAETIWGLNLCRIIVRRNEDAYWVPFPREWTQMGFARMSRAGRLVGLKSLKSRRRVEFMPFAAPSAARDYDAGTPVSTTGTYGADLRIGLTSNLTADLTYRTDFAQVEADQEVVNTSRFSLFFPEKRQFFTESAGIFDYGRASARIGGDAGDGGGPGLLPLFYSRRIGLYAGQQVPILGGGKLTGKMGPYTLGVMNIETDATRLPTDDGAELLVPRANYSVVRLKRNVLAKSTIGAVFLNRQGGPGAEYNRAAGLDLGLMLGRNTSLLALVARTFSPGVRGRDLAGAVDFSWKNDWFNYGFTYLDIPERFNAEMGYIRRLDIRQSKARAAWTPRPRWRGVRQLTFGGSADYIENHDKRVESRNQGADFSIQFQDSSNVRVSFDRDYDFLPYDWSTGAGTIPIGGYTWDTYRANYSTNQSRRVYGGASFEQGGYYNGEKRTYRGGLNFLPLETLLIETQYTRNQIALPGNPAYVTNTLSTRISYSFSPDLFVKTYLQYNDERRLASLNLLLWYIYRPGSDLYIVYNEGWETDVPGPRDLRVRNRSLAIKFTYWLAR